MEAILNVVDSHLSTFSLERDEGRLTTGRGSFCEWPLNKNCIPGEECFKNISR